MAEITTPLESMNSLAYVQTHQIRNPSVVLGYKTTQLNIPGTPTQTHSLTYKHTCCDITHIWMQVWLTHTPSSLQSVPHLPPFYTGYPVAFPSCLSVFPPPLSEMKEKNPWKTPVTIIITVIGVIAIVALVTVAVLQNKTLTQKYKV